MKNLKVNIVSGDDSLQELVKQINQSSWDEQNDVENYSIKSLLAYLEKEDTVFLARYKEDRDIETLAGMASGRIEQNPMTFLSRSILMK